MVADGADIEITAFDSQWYWRNRFRGYEYLKVRNTRMKGPGFKSAMRFILDYVGEGLMWMGLGMGPPFEMSATVAAETTRARRRARSTTRLGNVWEHPDQLSMTPLSRAERAEWAALVERLR